MFCQRARATVLRAAFTLCLLAGCTNADRDQIERAVIGRGRVVLVGEGSGWELHPNGTVMLSLASMPALAAALRGTDASAVAQVMASENVQGLLLDVREPASEGIEQQLAHMAHVNGLHGVFFNRSAAFYVLDPLRSLSPTLREGLAVVARRLVGGAIPPRISSFPEEVRRLDPVEVMVLLRSRGRPRLWRSARGSSFARALLTAAAVARQRWIERAATLGGRLDVILPTLTVEVSLLSDDGELGTRSKSFVDRVITLEHGVGFERKGNWHYLLPDATHRGGRTPSDAYRQLFSDNGVPADSLADGDMRLYRVAVQPIGSSAPAPIPDDGLSDVKAPSDILKE
ncbi:MAG TPA: hypothetical protein VFN67_15095 [Polyangiales bacterium]|nr:hypothetical protein [Polyangiales bacterium]